MQPQQPYIPPPQLTPPPQPAPTQNPYDFIVNPGKPTKPSRIGNLNFLQNKLVKYILIGFAAILLLIIAIDVISGGGPNPAPFQTVAEDQTEVLRVASLAAQQTTMGQASFNCAVTIQATLNSNLGLLLSVAASDGLQINTKQLSAFDDATTTQDLSNAANNGNYDSVFLGIMQTYLANYQKALKLAYDDSTYTNMRLLLRNEYNSASLLITQVGGAQQSEG